jgi:hypothetical protein
LFLKKENGEKEMVKIKYKIDVRLNKSSTPNCYPYLENNLLLRVWVIEEGGELKAYIPLCSNNIDENKNVYCPMQYLLRNGIHPNLIQKENYMYIKVYKGDYIIYLGEDTKEVLEKDENKEKIKEVLRNIVEFIKAKYRIELEEETLVELNKN